MAEYLVKAKDHWMDKLTAEDVSKLAPQVQATYPMRSQKGDILAVRPDGHIWGNEECLPWFIVYKVPGMSVDQDYEKPFIEVIDDVGYRRKKRKWNIDKADVDLQVVQSKNTVEKTKAVFDLLKHKKTLAEVKVIG